MVKERIEIMLIVHKRKKQYYIDVPISITANDLVLALNQAYDLGIDTDNITNCYLKVENPIVLIKGNKTIGEYGLRNGSVIHFTN